MIVQNMLLVNNEQWVFNFTLIILIFSKLYDS